MEVAEEKRKVACLGFVDARAMVSKDLLAIGVEAGIGGFPFAAGGVAVGGGVVPRRVAHLRRATANTESLRCSEVQLRMRLTRRGACSNSSAIGSDLSF